MANSILHKRSGTASAVPAANALSYGEIAVNYADVKAFIKNSSNVVVELGSNVTNATIGNLTITGTVASDLIPSANATYNLGNATTWWNELYLSGNTIYIGGESISVAENGTWTFSSGNSTVSLGESVEFNPPTANISGNLTAGNIFAGAFYYANGQALSAGGGSYGNTEVAAYLPTYTGNLAGGNISVSGAADIGGNLTVTGNLTVNGTTTTINSTTLTVDDINIVLAQGAANSTAANGAGFTVEGANAQITYASTGDKWTVNKNLDVTGNITANGVTLGSFAGSIISTNSNLGNITGTSANITDNTAATSTTTGALKVAGGVGVVGNVYANAFYYANGSAVTSGSGGISNIQVGGIAVSANASGTLTLAAGTNIGLTANSTSKIITISSNPTFPSSFSTFYGYHANGMSAHIDTASFSGDTFSVKAGNNISFESDYSGNLVISSSGGGGGGGGTLAIGNAVLLMWYDSSFGYYRMARGWVYKSDKRSSPSFSTLYFRFRDSYYASSLNPSWSTVKEAPTGGAASWFIDQSTESGASTFVTNVSMDQLYGLEFYSDYNFAGSTAVMPMQPSSMSATPGGTLKYPSGGLGVGSQSVYSGFDSLTNATWGYSPNYYIYFSYYLDGTQDSKIASFNYP